ncbi:MAG: hypothetical protein NZL92_10965 [Gloeomargarita sp. SKYG116]|nr:hypothetical protein [Gloeomargarita sp. SKYG116]MDW8402203.1 hypothetical protein [Gloeomargarita sp. SKYGB_i_bin116]
MVLVLEVGWEPAVSVVAPAWVGVPVVSVVAPAWVGVPVVSVVAPAWVGVPVVSVVAPARVEGALRRQLQLFLFQLC